MTKSVVIHGGGMAGAKLARALENVAEVTLVSPLDYFEIPMALPRALVEPQIAKRSVVPFTEALPKTRHLHGRVVSFDGKTSTIETHEGEKITLAGDITVLATGSRYANSVTRAQSGTWSARHQEFADFNTALVEANRILIVGGGPIGVELAGEITRDYAGKQITIVESNDDILTGTSRAVAAYARKELEKRGVRFVLGQRIVDPAFAETPAGGIARTDQGQELSFDLIYWAVGSTPNTDYLPKEFLSSNGRIPVDAQFRVDGMQNVFALGDIADLNEVKKAIYVNSHVKVAARNIISVLKERPPKACYKPQTGNDIMVVTLGRDGGVAHLPGLRMIKAGWLIRMVKARDMLVGMYRKAVGAATKA